MNCVWFEMRLDELLDERMPPDSDPELNEHAEHCSHCAQLLADHQALLEAIEVLVWPEARADLAARILAEVASEPVSTLSVLHHADAGQQAESAQRSLLRAATWIAGTMAAALLIGLGVMEWNRPHAAVPVADSKSPGISERSFGAEHPVADAVAERRGLLAIQSVSEVQWPTTTSLISPQQRVLMEQMTDGLKPVTHSMSAALNALRHTLPGSEAPARSS